MSCKPILFNTDMVKAILAGHKTQTRRIAFQGENLRPFRTRDYPDGWWFNGRAYKSFDDFLRDPQRPKCRYEKGNILWVRETWYKDAGRYMYRADYGENEHFYQGGNEIAMHWHPSIHMPKEAARIFLRVKRVGVERLQDITADGIRAEGLTSMAAACGDMEIALAEWKNLWDSTIKKADLPYYGWDANPWVWAIEFERCEKPEGWK